MGCTDSTPNSSTLGIGKKRGNFGDHRVTVEKKPHKSKALTFNDIQANGEKESENSSNDVNVSVSDVIHH